MLRSEHPNGFPTIFFVVFSSQTDSLSVSSLAIARSLGRSPRRCSWLSLWPLSVSSISASLSVLCRRLSSSALALVISPLTVTVSPPYSSHSSSIPAHSLAAQQSTLAPPSRFSRSIEIQNRH